MASPNEPDPNLDVNEVVEQVVHIARNIVKRFGPILALLLLLLVGLAGLYKVDPGARAVVLRFGVENRRTEPGLRYALPLIEKVYVVDVEEIRRVEIGFNGKDVLPEALMLTGDENIVEVRMVVQYRVSDPGNYLFRIAEPEITLRAAAEVAIRTVVGQRRIDDVMTKGRAQVQSDTIALLQKLMDEYQSGIEITEVKLDNVDAPNEVKDAFNAVTRAREEREKLINQAQGYAADKVPRARGDAEKALREAEAYKEQRILHARGDAARFEDVRAEYEKAKVVTRTRMHLETLERVLSKVEKKTLVDGEIASRGVPLLPIGGDATSARMGGAQ